MSKYAKFNRDEVVEKATNLYWEKGFHGTSMRNLQDVVDMRPGSIYATFGSKENLFKEAIQNYAATFETQLDECLRQHESPLEALKIFVRKVIIDSRVNAPSGMCMLVKTVAELTEEQGELLTEAKRLLGEVETAFTEILEDAIAKGELSESKNPVQLARYLQVQVIGLRTYARANEDEEAVIELVDNIFEAGPFNKVTD